jgi:spermidine/putrescine transport system ATP-binding protein
MIEQIGTGREIYAGPRTPFVASFVGENNGFAGRIGRVDAASAELETPFGTLVGRRGEGAAPGRPGTIFIRPESLRVAAPGEAASIQAEILTTAYEGSATHLFLRDAEGRAITMTAGNREAAAIPAAGARIGLVHDPAEAIVLATDGPAA